MACGRGGGAPALRRRTRHRGRAHPRRLLSFVATGILCCVRQAAGWAFVRDDGQVELIAPIQINPSTAGVLPTLAFSTEIGMHWQIGLDSYNDLAISQIMSGQPVPAISLTSHSLSLRQFAKLGSALSVVGPVKIGGHTSLLNYVNMGSSISCRSFVRLGSGLSIKGHFIAPIEDDIQESLGNTIFHGCISVFNFVHLGSSLSLRSQARVGSQLALCGGCRLGSHLSVLDYLHLGSSLSLRAFSRLGATLSVVGRCWFPTEEGDCTAKHYTVTESLKVGKSFLGGTDGSLSTYGDTRLGLTLSVLGFSHIGSSLSLRNHARFGSSFSAVGTSRFAGASGFGSLSILDCSLLGSSLSLRNVKRLGSSISVTGLARLSNTLSILNYGFLGASLSLRSVVRCGSALSVCYYANIGSSLSLRSYARIGRSLSVLNQAHFGSAISVRSYGRLSSSLSVMDRVFTGSSLSIRTAFRIASGFSVVGVNRMGSSLSVFNFLTTASSLSLRSFSRLGSSISVLGYHHVGSSLSLRCIARMGSALEAFSQIKLTYPGTGHYASYAYTVMDMEAEGPSKAVFKMKDARGSPQVISFEKFDSGGTLVAGGTLHGLWTSDEVVASSSRDVKTNIANLEDYAGRCQTFKCRAASRHQSSRRKLLRRLRLRHSGKKGSKPKRSLFPLLKELRPVAYRYKDAETGKGREQVRFGFVADELEELVPEVVRQVKGKDKTRKGVVYQDLIALLVAGMREHQGRLEAVEQQRVAAEESAPQESAAQRELADTQKQLAATQAELQRVQATLAQLQQKALAQEARIAEQAEQQRKAQLLEVLRHSRDGGDSSKPASGSKADLAALVTDLQHRMEQQERRLQRVVENCECAQPR